MGGCLVFIFGAVFEYAYVSLVASNLEISGFPTNSRGKLTSLGQKKCKTSSCEEKEELLPSGEKKSHSKESGLCAWWHHWTYQADASKMIDLYSRILFPLSFAVFNVFYWAWYTGL